MIRMKDWKVFVPEVDRKIGHETDNKLRRLRIECDLDGSWAVFLDVEMGGAKNTISLDLDDGILSTDLTAEMLPKDGFVIAQVRGINGDVVAHSNEFRLEVGRSINAIEAFEITEPSAIAQMEARVAAMKVAAEEAAASAAVSAEEAGNSILNAPYIGENGNWFVFDPETGEYADTGRFSGGETPYIGSNGNWFVGGEDTGVSAKGEKGDPGEPGEKGDPGERGPSGVYVGSGEMPEGCNVQIDPDGDVTEIVSPTVEVTAIEGGHRIAITDVDGTKTVDVMDGEKGEKGDPGAQGEQGETGTPGADGQDGYTPAKGVDYWTEEDRAEMVSDVLAALPVWEGGSY